MQITLKHILNIAEQLPQCSPVWAWWGPRGKSWRLHNPLEPDDFIRGVPTPRCRVGYPLQFPTPIAALAFKEDCLRRLAKHKAKVNRQSAA